MSIQRKLTPRQNRHVSRIYLQYLFNLEEQETFHKVSEHAQRLVGKLEITWIFILWKISLVCLKWRPGASFSSDHLGGF